MKINKATYNLFLTLFALGATIWLGVSISRTIIGYDIFIPGTALELKNWYSNEMRVYNVQMFGILSIYSGVGYGIYLVSAIFLFVSRPISLKRNGWLLMSFVLILIAMPIEFYAFWMDYKLNKVLEKGLINYDLPIIAETFLYRLREFSIPGTMSILANLTAWIFIIWQPLKIGNSNET